MRLLSVVGDWKTGDFAPKPTEVRANFAR